MIAATLFVQYRTTLVGTLQQRESGRMQFQYAETWCGARDSFPISLSLPLDGAFSEAASHGFFANLLPEGPVREQICRVLQISLDNDFHLLQAIGGDCAGALTIADSLFPEDDGRPAPGYERVTEEQLARWSMGAPTAFSAVTGRNQVRLSLAGAQDKLPVHVDGPQILIPRGSAPSTHIVKFASLHYSHLPENETFVTLLAREIGLPAVDVCVRKTSKSSYELIARYDRRFVGGQWQRLHQEDFCQALGIRPSQKYEKEGGPSLRQGAEVIRRGTAFPLVDLQKLLQWSLFNLLVGNSDAHGKNLSLLYDDNPVPRLAPFYDLVCIRNYKNLSRELAMNLGGAWDPDLVSKPRLEQLAADLSFRPSVVLTQFTTLRERIASQLPVAVEKFAQQFGDSPVLERVPILIRKNLRRLGR